MRCVHSTDTAPEKVVRSLLHRLGFRFRLQRKNLPGKPDIVLPKFKAVIFVHGCFWHRHQGCPRASTPASRQEYWLPKFERTKERDAANQALLKSLGWRVEIIWECETKNLAPLADRLQIFLHGDESLYEEQEEIIVSRAAENQGDYRKTP